MEITSAVADAQRADRIAVAARARAARAGARFGARSDAGARELDEVRIRLARPADAAALERLRLLDGRTDRWAGEGDVLVAVADGSLVAALPLARPDDVIADPFRRTIEVARLLQTRAHQLSRPVAPRRHVGLPRLIRAR